MSYLPPDPTLSWFLTYALLNHAANAYCMAAAFVLINWRIWLKRMWLPDG
jgi:hypothetical protein